MENEKVSGEGGIAEIKTYRLKKASEDASVYRLIMMAIKSAFYNNEEYWHEEDS
ncbi:Uncharacterised protein [Salmonella enterica subsp. enterica]|uniref:Uncharacterized protein n=1 Tax=Salmonella enterica I TaxID=59201 RepID=A0A447PWK3_SALET|nr:Uncharacterised protein [Salmonella enterica subsp. enterica]